MGDNLNNKKIYINSKDLNTYLNYFGLGFKYTINDLEYKRYQLLNERPEEEEKINRIYEILATLKINEREKLNISNMSEFDINKYKVVYLESFNKSFSKIPLKNFTEYLVLNDLIQDIKNIVDSTRFQLENTNDKETIRKINFSFYSDYSSAVSSFIDEYFKSLNDKNKHKVEQLLENVRKSYHDKIFDYPIADLIDAINDSIMLEIREYKFKKYAIKSATRVITQTDVYFKDETISNVVGKYYNMIDEFLNKQLSTFVSSIEKEKLNSKEEADQKLAEFMTGYIAAFSNFQNELSLKITKELIKDSQKKYAAKTISDSVYHEIIQRLNSVEQFQDLAVIHDMVYPKKKDGELQII